MKKKLQLSKEMLKALSRTQLDQVAGGTQPGDGAGSPQCDAVMLGNYSVDASCNML
jgi:hypothetical protein